MYPKNLRRLPKPGLAWILLILLSPPRTWAQPEMGVLWPNDDGHSWEYEQVYDDRFSGDHVENSVRLFFDGTDVVPGGISVQNLKVEVLGAPPRLPAPADPEVPTEAGPFLRTLWTARPDLRARIKERIDSGTADLDRYPDGFYQILIGEAAYRKTEAEICAYRRDVTAMKSWLWLVADLTIGNGFALQLVPDLADDIWLYGTMAAWEDVDVPGGHFPGCLRVDYRIDYGESACTDEQGVETGGFRSETRGFIHFAPEVGPIDHTEEFIPFLEFLWGECPGWDGYEGVVFTSGSLRLAATPPTPIRTTSWGRLKESFFERR